jgi:glycogen debranching enzyme
LFGRDTLTAAWQSAIISGDLMLGVLPEIMKRQGTRTNDWRDEEPGRMLHQAETGPLAVLNFNPNALNYFSVTTAAFYPVVVATLWHWTGDHDLVRRFVAPALKGLQWLDDYSDVNGDGFYEYQTRSKDGVKHQAWKDSIDAIVYPDGSQVDTPIAACEQQAYVYVAKYLLAEVLWGCTRMRRSTRCWWIRTCLNGCRTSPSRTCTSEAPPCRFASSARARRPITRSSKSTAHCTWCGSRVRGR